jgi:hypothetical protein
MLLAPPAASGQLLLLMLLEGVARRPDQGELTFRLRFCFAFAAGRWSSLGCFRRCSSLLSCPPWRRTDRLIGEGPPLPGVIRARVCEYASVLHCKQLLLLVCLWGVPSARVRA